MRCLLRIIAPIAVILSAGAPLSAAEYVKSDAGETSGYSQAVVTNGGRIIWLAGADAGHYPEAFEAQVRDTFNNIQATLAKQNARLSDIVTMTVYLKDVRYREAFGKVRREFFKENFPASTQITVTGFAGSPDQLVEVQAVAVVQ
jgi:2-iminobutanoate/2-iminopropanoate deaminase